MEATIAGCNRAAVSLLLRARSSAARGPCAGEERGVDRLESLRALDHVVEKFLEQLRPELHLKVVDRPPGAEVLLRRLLGGVASLEIDHIREQRLVAEQIHEPFGETGTAGRDALDVGLQLRDLRLDLDQQRI